MLSRLIANGLLQAAAAIGLAALVQRVVDHYILNAPLTGSPADAWSLSGHVAAALAVVALGALLRWRERVDREVLAQTYVHHLRKAMYSKLARTPTMELDRRRHGGILLRFLGDLTAISQWVSLGFAKLGVAAVTITVTFAVLAARDAQLVLLVGAVLAGGALLVLLLGRSMDAAVSLTRRRRTYLANNIAEKMLGLSAVQAFGRRRHERKRLHRQSGKLRAALIVRARSIGAINAIAEATGTLAMLAALLLGVTAVESGASTPGSVVALMAVIGLLAAPIRDLGKVYEYWRRGRISQEKIESFLAAGGPNIDPAFSRVRPGPGRLQLIDIALSSTLPPFNAVAPAGSRIVLEGGAGCGKSKLLRVAAGLLSAEDGEVLLDGQSLATLRRDSLSRAVGMVSPDLPLVRGTIDDNVRFARPSASEKSVARVCALCGLDALAAALPEGLATRVSEGGRNLSAGQRQRVALARALLPRPRLLLLDDVDVGLDPAMRETLLRVMAAFKGTILLVTRDAVLRASADACWYVETGHVRKIRLREPARTDAVGTERKLARRRI